MTKFIVLKPARKPREVWLNYYGDCCSDPHRTEDDAKSAAALDATEIAVHFVEKLK